LADSRRSIELQPNDPYVNAYHAVILSFNGQAKLAIPFARRALRLDPLVPRSPYLNILGMVYFHAGEFVQAQDAFDRNVSVEGHTIRSFELTLRRRMRASEGTNKQRRFLSP